MWAGWRCWRRSLSERWAFASRRVSKASESWKLVLGGDGEGKKVRVSEVMRARVIRVATGGRDGTGGGDRVWGRAKGRRGALAASARGARATGGDSCGARL